MARERQGSKTSRAPGFRGLERRPGTPAFAGASGSETRVRVDRAFEKAKTRVTYVRRVFIGSGGDLLSHSASAAVPSAQEGLTTEFEMGSGVTPPA